MLLTLVSCKSSDGVSVAIQKKDQVMARGNGKQAQQAKTSGLLSAFVTPKSGADNGDGGREYVDWGEVNPNLMVGAVQSVVREGGALLYGCSRDNSCYSVKVYAGGDSKAYYFNASERGIQELEDFLMALYEIGQ